MSTLIQYNGYWSIPGSDKEYFGHLKLNDGELELSLIGPFSWEDLEESEIEIIYGTPLTGKAITLYKCSNVGKSYSFPGLGTISFSALYMIKGARLEKNDLFFNISKVQFHSLEKWVDISGIEKNDFTAKTTLISYSEPEPINFYQENGVNYTIEFSRSQPLGTKVYDFKIKQLTQLFIEDQNGFDISGLWTHLNRLRGFLTLAFFSDAKIKSIDLKKGDEILELQFAGLKDYNGKPKERIDFLFQYKQIEKSFSSIFLNWVNVKSKIEPVINVLQESFSNRQLALENRFINIAQAIETFHRRLRKNEKENIDDYKAKVAAIVEQSPDEYKKWLSQKLYFGNEPTLNERLQELFDEIDLDLKDSLFPEYEKMIKQTKDSRNYYTHYSAELEKKACKGSELYYITERLRIFLLILILNEIGIENEGVSLIIKQAAKYNFNHLIVGGIDNI